MKRLTDCAGLRCRGCVFAGRKTDRLLLAARCLHARTFAGGKGAAGKGSGVVWRHLPHERRRLESAPADDSPGYDGGPFFSPDGQRIVWRRFDASGMNADVFTMKTDGSDVRRDDGFQDACRGRRIYHPSGKYLIFTSNKLGFENFELFVVDADGAKEPVRVTFTDGFDGLPVFSPDGKRLAWTSRPGSEARVRNFAWRTGMTRRRSTRTGEAPAARNSIPAEPTVSSAPRNPVPTSLLPPPRAIIWEISRHRFRSSEIAAEVAWLASAGAGRTHDWIRRCKGRRRRNGRII